MEPTDVERVKNILTSYREGLLTEADFMLALLTICPSIESLVEVALTFQAEDAGKIPPNMVERFWATQKD